MKMRTRKPAAGTASASVIQYEMFSVQIISAQRARYGITELVNCQTKLPDA